jgi:hypothetical protein
MVVHTNINMAKDFGDALKLQYAMNPLRLLSTG